MNNRPLHELLKECESWSVKTLKREYKIVAREYVRRNEEIAEFEKDLISKAGHFNSMFSREWEKNRLLQRKIWRLQKELSKERSKNGRP